MRPKHFWGAIWFILFPILLTAISRELLPETPTLQLLIVPTWAFYWLLARPERQSLWITCWHAILCETAWTLPPGTCVTFFMLLWWIVRTHRDLFPINPQPYHGLLCGVTLLPVLRIWIWLYAILWPTLPDATPLRPTLLSLILLPAVGALGGSMLFALAEQTSFLIFRPTPKEMLHDES